MSGIENNFGIGATLQSLVKNHINPYLVAKTGTDSTDTKIVLGNIAQVSEQGGDILNNSIVLSLINIEEDRISRSPDPFVRQGGTLQYKNPPIFLNLYVLFAANFTQASYETSLGFLTYIIQFFQYQNVFNRLNAPDLPGGIEELIFDLKTLSMQDLNNMWGVLGSKYLPCVLYKVRLLTINEDFSQGDVLPVTEIMVNDKTLNPS